jgi:glycosyltransferase involved in cell wall biosynthesis
LKILVCSANMYPPFRSSGIGNVIFNIVRHLHNAENEIDVCVPVEGDIKLLNENLIKKNINFIYNHYGISVIYLNIYFWYKVKKFIKTNYDTYDIFWLHNPHPLFFRKFDKAIITMHTTHHGILQSGQSDTIFAYLYSKLINTFELDLCINPKMEFIAVSSTVLSELKQLGVKQNNLTYINNGVDVSAFKPANNNKNELREKFNLPKKCRTLLSVGRLIELKQPIKLIETFQLVQEKLDNINLVIIGDGPLFKTIGKIIHENNIKNILLMGYVDEKDKNDLYACSDYYIITSKYEGQPLTLLEAMASGLPCIVSDIPNLRIVEEADCGIIVDFSDKNKAANEIIDYVKHDNSEHGKNARKYAEEYLDWSIIAEKYLEQFEEML